MILRTSICVMAFYLFLSAPSSPGEDSLEARTQDFKKVVLPIADVKLSDVRLNDILGTGFCLDPECRFVGTTYHLARIAQPKKIKGQKVIRLDLATEPDDEGATDNYITIAVQAEHHQKVYWCRGEFTDYQVFGSRVKIVAN